MRHIGLGFLIFILSACASPLDKQSRHDTAQSLSQARTWSQHDLTVENFTLRSYGAPKLQATTDTRILRIYIEGDGLAWLNRYTPSPDPTPINPLALKLALADSTFVNRAYLARPCQYNTNDLCQDKRWWTGERFSPQAVRAMSEAIDQLKNLYQAEQIELVGFSGGGVIAALLAAERADITRFITVASPLDTQKWVEHHRISPLAGSLNPANSAHLLRGVPQYHFVGEHDRVVPLEVVKAYIQHLGTQNNGQLHLIAKQKHDCCWADIWPDLLTQTEY